MKTEQAHIAARVSTAELAERTGLRPIDLRAILHAAGVPSCRCGSSYLWRAADAEEVLGRLRLRSAEAGVAPADVGG